MFKLGMKQVPHDMSFLTLMTTVENGHFAFGSDLSWLKAVVWGFAICPCAHIWAHNVSIAEARAACRG